MDQNNICVSIIFKAKTKEKYEENLFSVFVEKKKLINRLFWGSANLFFKFFLVLALKTMVNTFENALQKS